MPREPRILTEEERNKVEAYASVLTADQIADCLSIGRTTFYDIMNRDEDVAVRYKKGKSETISVVAQNLKLKALEGDTASMIFFLKTQAGWRETQKIDHSSEDGSMATKEITLDKKTIDAAIKKLNDEY